MSSALHLYHQNARLLNNCFSLRCLQFSSLILNISQKHRYCTIPSANSNPLIDLKGLPDFHEVTGEAINEALPYIISETEKEHDSFDEILKTKDDVSWDDVVPKSEKIFDSLTLAWNAVSHLHGVKNNAQLREAYQKVQPDLVRLGSKASQSKSMYKALKILDGKKSEHDEAQNRIIESSIRSAKLSGVHLEGSLKEEFNQITQQLAELGTKFQNNVLDSTKAFSYMVDDEKDLEGLPSSVKTLMATNAGQHLNKTVNKEEGPWRLSLDMPCFDPFMKYSLNSSLRQMIYTSYISRASIRDHDNSPNIEQIRQLRKRKSQILGFKNFAELSTSKKMSKTPEAVWKMIKELASKAKPVAKEELETLQGFANSRGFEVDLQHWDIAFWSEKQKEHTLSLNEERLREYFPLPKVLEGLFSLSQEIFGIKITEVAPNPTWHEDVKFFDIQNSQGEHIASFYLDLYSRPHEKQGGAWMGHAIDRNDALGRKPVAYLVCNQSPPIGEDPSLMTFREAITLFHEFGHGLQHMLTTVKYQAAAGINNIEYDAVELPSQFMENWLYDWNTLQKVTSHYKTGETLPQDFFKQIVKGKLYNSGLATMRQLYFGALDMELHTSDDPWQEVMQRISKEYTLMTPLPVDSFPCSFLHIFSYGYAAGYYSYKWAEVLSADAFAAFEEVSLNDRQKVAQLGERFRDTVLSLGGGRHPEQVFIDFRGRKPDVSALLKSHGLL